MNYYNLANYFYDIVSKYSDQTALCYNNTSITYDELNKLSNKIANYFLSLGIKKYDVIGIFNTKEPVGYATMLACLKIGAAYTNIDEENPLVRLEKIINTCKPKLLVCNHTPFELIQKASKDLHINLVDFGNNTLFKYFKDKDLEVSKKIVGSTPAYIMFTSGSTGSPKGVAVSHSNVLSFLGWSIERYGVTTNDIFAGISPLYFDNSVFDFYTALFSGASLVPVEKEVAKNPQELIKLVDKMRCTVWFSVPSLLVYLLTIKLLSEKTLQSIKIFTFGGEGFPKGELKKLYNLYSEQAKFINVYGPTEGTCICSSYDISQKDFEDMQTLAPLGTINPNFEYMIVDKNMQEVQEGEKGELCLAGQNIALGYYNDIERTSQNFVQNPFITTHRDIIYKTGDIVYEKDGLLWFAGRVDNQIKHMGYRIELEEIESALNSIPYVSQSAVIYERVKLNYGKIVAFIATDQNISEREIKNDLNTMLPSYMIPTIIKTMQNLPKNKNGKVDKKQLFSTL
ncbi:amino acid adenylation domain-containing protein [Sulfurimonas sp.]|jgi:D-alanine--poly(phosphoribitol) ligase subunit 1|uniref:amino acid adenylation domain-containing protein n=1 Tax=Sulfurimonas sp. TaxID=2022749 RepID=UPI0025D11419|nr:amino acid adenylation domain-containing protein [Sulfurimonas sp.]MCK9472195.1 amino acid adenylation domain-containing protein [Sulfurimonas sp.]MDD3504971.1 amino acid adenylation domain-containing protein [Sulfurimonas sp.]